MTTKRRTRYVSVPEFISSYRLWHTTNSPGSPNLILVHGAVIPLPTTLHTIDHPNNCFFRLEQLLVHIGCNYDVWNFEYADIQVPGLPGYVNYGCLHTYGERLKQVIENLSTQDHPVTIIAHSMGGLIARYATQHAEARLIIRIITLDTGHLGFNLAGIVDDLFVEHLPEGLQKPACCSLEADPTHRFIEDLTAGFPNRTFDLVSLAAQDELPLPPPPLPPGLSIRVVPWSSSSMGQVDDSGHPTERERNIDFEILLNCNHLTISQINNENHPAFVKIRQLLCQHS